ncbi:MAG: ADP-ribosylglycohydrolase family protein [Desulfatiglandales bacterium]
MDENQLRNRFRGVILGTAVGDALGLPAEGISPRRAGKLFGGRWQHRFVGGRGMVSDDTDHTVFVAQSLLKNPESPELFAKALACCFRWWLLSIPAGIGLATLKSIIRLWLGFRPLKSGVYSAGNGPAMRSAPIGAFFASSPNRMDDYLEACTKITHTDPRALVGAKAVAYIVAWSIREKLTKRPGMEAFLQILQMAGEGDEEWSHIQHQISMADQQNLSVVAFARELGLVKGVTGYIYHTVPVVLYAWYRHFGAFEETLNGVLDCGGDTDTTGAIAGALAGAVVGEQGIPRQWLDGIFEWPRSVKILKTIGDRLCECSQQNHAFSPVPYFRPGVLPRNLFFLLVVLLHGFRRLAPPY